MEKKLDIVVVGELNVDLILTGLHSLPELGKVKLSDDMHFTLGSASAIFASNISKLGLKVGFIGKVGEDEFGDFILDKLKNNKVETSQIRRDENAKTGICVSLSFPEDYAMASFAGARHTLTLADVNMDYVSQARHLHMSSYYLQTGMMDGCPGLFERAKEVGMTTSLDPDTDPTGKWDLSILELLKFVDVFLPNESEALQISNCETIESALDFFNKIVGTVVIKTGSTGAWVKSDNKTFHADTFKVDVVDTTGAGDSFNSGFICKFYQGSNIQECMLWGNACAAISTTELGGTTAFPDLIQLEQFLADRKEEISHLIGHKD